MSQPYNLAEIERYIHEAAVRRNMDPQIALRVARSEGLGQGIWRSRVPHRDKARAARGETEPSFGPFQLLEGGPGTGYNKGVGNDFRAATGLDPSDPKNVKAAIDFALDVAAKEGWGKWMGAAKVGVGRWDGIRGEGRHATPLSEYTSMGRTQPAVPDNIAREYGLLGQEDDITAMARRSPRARDLYPEEGLDERPLARDLYPDEGLDLPAPRQPTYNNQPMDAHGPISTPPVPAKFQSQPPSLTPFQQFAQSFDPNSIDQNAWIDPMHGHAMAYNHARSTGDDRLAGLLAAGPSTMQTRFNPKGIAHGFARALLNLGTGEIDSRAEEAAHMRHWPDA